mgnify:CR=1 FL=1
MFFGNWSTVAKSCSKQQNFCTVDHWQVTRGVKVLISRHTCACYRTLSGPIRQAICVHQRDLWENSWGLSRGEREKDSLCWYFPCFSLQNLKEISKYTYRFPCKCWNVIQGHSKDHSCVNMSLRCFNVILRWIKRLTGLRTFFLLFQRGFLGEIEGIFLRGNARTISLLLSTSFPIWYNPLSVIQGI